MTDFNQAEFTLAHGNKWPYDASDSWWNKGGDQEPPAPTDWAHAAARGIMSDLNDRRGIKWEFANLDEDIRAEIVGAIADIIRLAASQGKHE